ncbi:DUF5713 family protein [Streptomyces sp. NPDC050263]|uniref:DUF5713 family protein n=1 Tax=Streptomyces sp. NPDC050263 TaxID=3155037 RepID=UPI0034129097
MAVSNEQVAGHAFLKALYRSDHYPDEVLDRGKGILLRLCERVETERPSDLAALYALTQAATEEFNDLQEAFREAGSELETVAREETAGDFWFVARVYGFEDADVEKLIATRDW